MNDDDKTILQNVLKMSEENNKMLKRIERRYLWSSVGKAIYWALIIMAIYGSYYYVQPYLGRALDMYNTASSQLQKMQNATDLLSNTVNKNIPIKR
ncbi:MAG: hypothetical protein WCL61_03145 [bacterium]